MFKRSRRREHSAQERHAETQALEIAKLKSEVARLEAAVKELVAASDASPPTLRRAQRERLRRANRAAPAFADAWRSSEGSPPSMDEFFTVGEVDKRARRWLLSPN